MKILLFILLLIVVAIVARKFLRGSASYPSIAAGDLAQLKAEQPKLVIIDVRTPGEIAQGKIKGALEINVQSADFKERIAKLAKDKTYLVYCRSGSRSAHACNIMTNMGFEKIYNLSGGYMAWPGK